jgi:lipopolysaccharide heptosyltransferase II
MRVPLNSQPRILITRTDRIGDLVLSTPVFRELRKKFPGAHLACLTFPENREIVEGNPDLNEVIPYDKKGRERGFLGHFLFSRRLARKKFDVVIHLHSTNRVHLAGWLAGIPVRIGWKRKCVWTLTHAKEDIKREGKKHEAEYNFDLLECLGVDCPTEPETYFPLSDRARISLKELIRHLGLTQDRPWVAVCPGASCPSKRWPEKKFSELMDRLDQTYRAHFVLVGSRGDRILSETIKTQASAPVYDLCGRLSLSMLGWFFKQTAVLISNDSGPVHIASAVGTPVISIFGRKQPGLSPARWKPLGSKGFVIWKDAGCRECLAHRCQKHFRCLEAVTVDDVLDRVRLLPDVFQSGEKRAGT